MDSVRTRLSNQFAVQLGFPSPIFFYMPKLYLLFNFEIGGRGDGAVAAAAAPRTSAAVQRLRRRDIPDLDDVQLLFSLHFHFHFRTCSSLHSSTLHGQLTPPLSPNSPFPFGPAPPSSVLRAFGSRHWPREAAVLSAKIGATAMRRANGRCSATTVTSTIGTGNSSVFGNAEERNAPRIHTGQFSACSTDFVKKYFYLFVQPPIITQLFILQREEGRRE